VEQLAVVVVQQRLPVVQQQAVAQPAQAAQQQISQAQRHFPTPGRQAVSACVDGASIPYRLQVCTPLQLCSISRHRDGSCMLKQPWCSYKLPAGSCYSVVDFIP
jgi:hypothetical protein